MRKNIIVTGANGNLGKAITEKFSAAGHKVWGTVRQAMPAENAFHDYHETAVDLTDENAAANFVQSVADKDGIIDCAVLTAGGYDGGNILQTTKPGILKQIELNFITAFNIARPVFTQMQKQKNGRIFLFGSKPGTRMELGKDAAAYAFSKSLIFRLAEMLNAEAGQENIVTSVIVPGTIDTPDNRQAMPGAAFDKWVTTQEIADVIYFYCSKEAASVRHPVIHIYNQS